jgi:nicotinamidase-related amidase
MDAILVVDMQVGLRSGEPKHDLYGVMERINRAQSGVCGSKSSPLPPQCCTRMTVPDCSRTLAVSRFLPELLRDPADLVVEKTLNDPFAGTDLQARLREIAPDRVLVAGWATGLCVDATVRSAVANHHNVVVVADGHTLSDRPHLDAISVIRHHHWVWSNLITQRSVTLANASELLL